MGRLTDKIAIVTGGAQGQGEAIVHAFVAEGARVATVAREALTDLPAGVSFLPYDLADASGIPALIERIKTETGCSVLIIEHDMPLITAVSDELVAFDLGRVLTRGRPDDVLDHPDVVASYLGTTEETIWRSGAKS